MANETINGARFVIALSVRRLGGTGVIQRSLARPLRKASPGHVSGWTKRGLTMIQHTISEMRRLWQDESGAAALEYGLIAAGIALAIISVVSPIGTKLASVFSNISAVFPAAT